MKKFALTLIVTLASFGMAQSFADVSGAVMNRIGVQEVACTELPSMEFLYQYGDSVCGFIMDTYHRINREWTDDTMASLGYPNVSGWQFQDGMMAAGYQGYGRTYMVSMGEIVGMTLFVMVDSSN